MKEGGDVFKKFRESFSEMDGHFHILEQQVPVEKQMEYFRYSERFKQRIPKQAVLFDDIDAEDCTLVLNDPDAKEADLVHALTKMATSRSVKAYRLLEEYVKHPRQDVAEWAYMALMECRISLESELSDEKQIYISTGLGGKGEKLRFYILVLSRDNKPFLEYQRQVIEREFTYTLPKADCEIERLTIEEQYVELLFLIPVRTDIKSTIDRIINECNQYGNFLMDSFTITNVKELTKEDIQLLLNKRNEDD